MVKDKSNEKKGVKEVSVKKPKEAPATPTQPLEKEIKPETIIEETKKLVEPLLKPIEQKDIVYTDTQQTKKRKKREKKLPIEPETKELQPTPEKKTRGNAFYIGLGFGLVIASVGIYFIYMKFKEWSKDPQREQDRILNQLEKEGVKSLENIRKE